MKNVFSPLKTWRAAMISLPQALFLVVASSLFALLFVRLFDLQVMRGDFFRLKADGNRFYTRYGAAQRGVFFDRFGDPLVVNVPKYYKLDDRESLYSQRQAISHSEALVEMTKALDAVDFDIERFYLFPNSTSHVLGYVSKVTAEELEKEPGIPISASVGKMGLELVYDQELRGQPSTTTYEINALGKKQRTLDSVLGVPGKDIQTTIDPYLSEVAYRALGDQRGSVVILDSDTGEVLSIVNAPSYDATLLSQTGITAADELIRRKKVSAYFSNPLKPFFNRAVAGLYPPGSVFKLVTAIAGLEEEKLEESTTVRDEGVLDVGEYSYANWYYTQYGRVEGDINVVRSIARSNDIFFYKTAEWVGPIKLGEYAQLFGYGQKTGIELYGEAAGLVPTPIWKEQTIGEKWYLGNTFHMGIGQGDVLVSPLQVASATQAFANHASRCAPRVIEKSSTDATCSELSMSEENIELVVEGMLDACSTGGTAYPFFEYNQQYRTEGLSAYEEVAKGAVACKTGTSEFGIADERGYKKTHGWFSMFFSVTTEMKNTARAQSENSDEVDIVETEEATGSAETMEINVQEEVPFEEIKKRRAEDYSLSELYQIWSQHFVEEYPKNLVIVTLVESDDAQPFKEGSRDAAPVAKFIFDWMHGEFPEE
ncbi:MAG: hypothetical protein H6773_04150 [Pseudomonadales bacterium]|nr:hypothetical protein [Candidatus Woesebacteria bacterium]MCB9801351.1 hypothetical protein [Pseudomonadales bacterium]